MIFFEKVKKAIGKPKLRKMNVEVTNRRIRISSEEKLRKKKKKVMLFPHISIIC